MIFFIILIVFMVLIQLGTGILFLINDRWMPRLRRSMSLPPPQSLVISRLSVWMLRVLGIFHITLSVFLFIAVAVPDVAPSLPFNIVFIQLLVYFLLGLAILVFSIMNKKRGSKKL